MNRAETITIVVVTDDHYVILLAALIRSIEENLSPGTLVDLWIVDDGVKEEQVKKMNESVNKQITTVHWKKMEEIMHGVDVPKDRSSFPLNIYARLLIPNFIPEGVEKVLYLDVDMIVLSDLLTLWHTDMGGHTIAAVTDPRVLTFDNHWGGVLNYKELGLPAKAPYFNTGLLLINTLKWREEKATEKILDVIRRNIKYANYPDQYGFNIVFANNWLKLDARWNHFASMACEQPYIIHFIERKPIYRAYKNSKAYRARFYKYLNHTA